MSGSDARATESPPAIPKNAGILKVALVSATLMQVLDMTIANVALPHMQASLGANQDTISWVLTSYIVASAIAMPVTGWLADTIGQRRLYLLSVASFVASSVLCGLATTIDEIVLFRLLQGVSGAFLTPLGQTVMLNITPPEKRGQAMSVFGMGIMVGPILGPVLGGWLTENFDWRWVFFVNVPFGLLALGGLWWLLPETPRRARSFDMVGFALLSIGLAALQLLLDRGQQQDWFGSAEIWLETFIAISAIWMCGVHLFTSRHPIFPHDMIADRNLKLGIVMMALMGFVTVAAMALLPVMLENLFGYPVMDAGLLLSTRGLGVMLAMGVSGRLVNRVDSRVLLLAGFVIVAYTFWRMSTWNLDVDGTAISLNGFIQGIGMGLSFVTVNTMAFNTLDPKYRIDGAGLINLSRSIGASVGISLVVTLLARSSATAHADVGAHVTPYSLPFDLSQLSAGGELGTAALSVVDGMVTRQAAMIGFLNDYYVMALVTVLVLPLALFANMSNGSAPKMGAADMGH